MDLITQVFKASSDDHIYFVEVRSDEDDWSAKRSYLFTLSDEANRLGIEFQHKELPEGIELRFHEAGAYETLMAAVDIKLQEKAEAYRRMLIERTRRAGVKSPPGFNDEYAIKNGKPPPGGWENFDPS